jgi:hypothetical protein
VKNKNPMPRILAAFAFLALAIAPLHAAFDKQPAPAGAPPNAPPQFTKFTLNELKRGFLALAFGSDLRLGAKPRGVRRFEDSVSVFIDTNGSIDRTDAMDKIVAEYDAAVPRLDVKVTDNENGADIVVHLIDEKNFGAALVEAFGEKTARAFVQKTDPQCMTSVKSRGDGAIVRATSFIIVDKGDSIFLDCAYHEMLHAFGLSNHDQHNPWTTLNQNRMVGYLSVYDRALLTLLYDPQIKAGMSRADVARLLPKLIATLPFAH